MSDDIDLLIQELERLIKEKLKFDQQARDLLDPLVADRSVIDLLADLENKLKPRSQRRAERYDETIEQLKANQNKPTGKPN